MWDNLCEIKDILLLIVAQLARTKYIFHLMILPGNRLTHWLYVAYQSK